MEQDQNIERSPRRNFLGTLASGAAMLGLATLAPVRAAAQAAGGHAPSPPTGGASEADLWFDKIKGSHRVVYDATQPHEIMPFAWPRVFLITNESTGTPPSDCGVVLVLRHSAIGYALKDEMWAKYGLAELMGATEHGGAFQAADAATATRTRNIFWSDKPGDFKLPGVGPVDVGIKGLMASGVMICVCEAAMTVYSAVLAGQKGLDAAAVLKEWKENLIPGIQPVPSGVWALGRAQERKCAYIFAG